MIFVKMFSVLIKIDLRKKNSRFPRNRWKRLALLDFCLKLTILNKLNVEENKKKYSLHSE